MAQTGQRLVTCPGCHAAEARCDGPPGTEFTVNVNGRDYTQPAYEILRCSGCGLVYKSTILSREDLADYYANVDYHKWEIPDLFPTERLVLQRFKELPVGSRLLDIGCSTGRLLSRLRAEYSCSGVEINPQAASEAAAKGIQMLDPTRWTDISLSPLDAISLVDVFEHLTEPLGLLTAAVNRLSPNGRLIICTGNADAPSLRGDIANSWYMRNVEHLIMMTRKYADHLASKLGLVITSWATSSHYDSSFLSRSRKWLRTFAFDVMHRSDCQGLARIFRLFPCGRRVSLWTERPAYPDGRDHVVIVFTRSIGVSGG